MPTDTQQDEAQRDPMDMPEFKIHDCVRLSLEYKDRSNSWYDKTDLVGVIMGLSDTKLIIKNPSGETEDIDLSKYTLKEAMIVSEVEYIEKIQEQINNAQRNVDSYIEDRDKAVEWMETYRREVSFIGRLLRMAKLIR